MELENTELTFDMIGNMSGEELDKINNNNEEEIIEEDNFFSSNSDEEDGEDDIIPEGVDDEDQDILEDTDTDESSGISPNLYTSIATSLKEDGILNLDDSDFENINDADSLALLFTKQMDKMLNEKQKRIDEALTNNVPVDTIKQYENIIGYLGNINEDSIREESSEAEQLRGQLITQDFLNKGFSPDRAARECKKSFDSGTDIEDALESLKECKDFYKNSYQSELDSAKELRQSAINREKENSSKLEKKFLDIEEPIKGVKLSKLERTKVLNQYTKYIDKDENNIPINAVQKYAKDNPIDYQYNINLLYYLTNGFKDLGTVIQKEVKNKTKSSLANLETTLRNPNNNLGSGGLDFGNDTSKESHKGISIDLN